MDKVTCRFGVFDGYDNYETGSLEKNDDAGLRYTGHIALNLVGDVEKAGWFCSQNRLGSANYIVLGAGIDSQQDATVSKVDKTTSAVAEEEDSNAFVVDLQSSFGLGDSADVLLNAAYYDWDNAAFEGNTAFVETGILSGKTMITAKWSNADDKDAGQVEDYTAGIHYFMKKQTARAGIEYRWGDSDDWILAGIQFLL